MSERAIDERQLCMKRARKDAGPARLVDLLQRNTHTSARCVGVSQSASDGMAAGEQDALIVREITPSLLSYLGKKDEEEEKERERTREEKARCK